MALAAVFIYSRITLEQRRNVTENAKFIMYKMLELTGLVYYS